MSTLRNSKRLPLAAAIAAVSLTSFAKAEDMQINGTVTDVFGHRVVIDSDGTKKLVNFGPKMDGLDIIKAGDKLSVTGEMKKSGEIHAQSLKLSDGREVVLEKDKKSWREWLLGENDDQTPFTEAEAKKFATDAGYIVSGDVSAEKKHFTADATKDGKAFTIEIHRDGKVKDHPKITATDAASAIVKDGYVVVGEVKPVKHHFEALAKKSDKFFEVHAHADGDVKEIRQVDKSDPKWGSQIN